MPLAYVLVNVEAGRDKEILDKIRKIAEIKSAYLVYGVYDIVAILESNTFDGLREIVTTKIRSLGEVISTVTMIVIEN